MQTDTSDLPHLAFQEYGASLQALQRAREALEELEGKVREAFSVFQSPAEPVASESKGSRPDVTALIAAHAQCQKSLMCATAQARQKFLVWLILRGEAAVVRSLSNRA
jgi:hypothetical protein